MPDAIVALDARTPIRIQDIAFGRVKPQTVSEAQAAVLYLEARRQAQIFADTERQRAALQFEKGTGTIAHVRRVARNIPEYSNRATIELERRARQAIGGTVRGLYYDLFGPVQPVQCPPPQPANIYAAEIQRRRTAGRPRTQQ